MSNIPEKAELTGEAEKYTVIIVVRNTYSI